jgi:flagellar motor switch protein FliN
MTDNQPTDLRIELGRTRLDPAEIRQLRPGTVVSLSALAGGPVDVYAAGRLVARGESVVHDGRVAVRVVELIGLPSALGRQKCVA